jgi:prepilin-type N-terminal cleavage/methylation domain-containing protein
MAYSPAGGVVLAGSASVQASSARGYSLIEILIVVAIIGIVSAIAVPQVTNMMGYLKLDGDARNLRNAVSLARMQAAANFSQMRVFLDTTTNGYHLETQTTTTPWTATGGTTFLTTASESYGFGVVGQPPPNTQAAIAQAPACMDNATPPAAIANSRCIVFNSRGIPIDTTGAPTGNYALYMTDGTAVYGLTVSATSSIKLWRTPPNAVPTWIQQ